MARRRVAEKRKVLPDPKYGNEMLAKFVNMIMKGGKKSIAERIVYDAMSQMQVEGELTPLDMVSKALDNVQPMVEVKSRRVGGATYQVPVEVRASRQRALAMRWVIDASRKRSEKSMAKRLAGELSDAASNKGTAVKKREDTHRMAEANKAFAHYRW